MNTADTSDAAPARWLVAIVATASSSSEDVSSPPLAQSGSSPLKYLGAYGETARECQRLRNEMVRGV